MSSSASLAGPRARAQRWRRRPPRLLRGPSPICESARDEPRQARRAGAAAEDAAASRHARAASSPIATPSGCRAPSGSPGGSRGPIRSSSARAPALPASRDGSSCGNRPWIADLNDPWAFSPKMTRRRFRDQIEWRMEKATVGRATRLTATTPTMSAELERRHGIPATAVPRAASMPPSSTEGRRGPETCLVVSSSRGRSTGRSTSARSTRRFGWGSTRVGSTPTSSGSPPSSATWPRG